MLESTISPQSGTMNLATGRRAGRTYKTKNVSITSLVYLPLQSAAHKVHIYIEYHSVCCPLVGIGTPLSRKRMCLPPEPRGGGGGGTLAWGGILGRVMGEKIDYWN
jgi:hypothetical protein